MGRDARDGLRWGALYRYSGSRADDAGTRRERSERGEGRPQGRQARQGSGGTRLLTRLAQSPAPSPAQELSSGTGKLPVHLSCSSAVAVKHHAAAYCSSKHRGVGANRKLTGSRQRYRDRCIVFRYLGCMARCMRRELAGELAGKPHASRSRRVYRCTSFLSQSSKLARATGRARWRRCFAFAFAGWSLTPEVTVEERPAASP